MTTLEYALLYAQLGWYVFPLIPGTKRPLTPNGFKDATLDEEQIRAWWDATPDANIAIATGPSHLVVVDFDKKSGGLETFATYFKNEPDLHTVLTGGGGLHLYYRGNIKSRAGILPGMDVRSEGGYVVAPPSVHESGNYYEWTYPGWQRQLPPPLTSTIEALLVKPTSPQAPALLTEGTKGQLNKRTLKFLTFGCGPGLWHQEFFQAAMNMKQNGYTVEEAKALLSKVTGILDEEHDLPQLYDVYENRTPIYEADLAATPITPSVPALGETQATATDSLIISAGDLSTAMIEHLSDKAKVKGEPTLLAGLDTMLGGGKRTGEVTAWHAEAKTGKNTLWHKLMHLWLKGAIAQGYASRELTPESEVLPNLLSLEYGENAWLSDMTKERKDIYCSALSSWPLYFARGYGYFPLEEIKRWVGSLRSLGVKFFWFDHLHYMLEDPEDHKAASKLIKEIKTMAKEEDIHVDIIIQPNKLAEGQRLSLNSIKGGSAMGQALDNLFILERVKGHQNIVKLTLDVARSKLCKPGKMFLQYNPSTTDFFECEEEVVEQPTHDNWSARLHTIA